MKYVYIHGFNSGKNSSTGKVLKGFLGDVICLEYDSSKFFNENLSSLKDQLLSQIDDEDFVLIGSSLGGFYVERLGVELRNYNHIGNVLINPCNNPKDQLKQFLGKTKSFETNKEWLFTEEILDSYDYVDTRSYTVNRVVIIGMKDEVINPIDNINYWVLKASVFSDSNEAHQIQNIDKYRFTIKTIENSFWG